MVIADEAGRIVLANARADILFGYARDELLGEPIEALVPERHREIHAKHRAEYARNPRTRPMGAGLELRGLRKDGTEFAVDISLAPMKTTDGMWFIATVRDVAEHEQAEAEGRHLRAVEK